MRKGDFVFILVLAALILFIALPVTSPIFLAMTAASPYGMAFLKFFIMATMGDLLGLRILSGKWTLMTGQIYRSVIWGVLGMLISLIFEIFYGGSGSAMAKSLLPGGENMIVHAFWASALMNCFFAPVMMGLHRVTDTYIDLKYKSGGEKVTVKRSIETVNWSAFIQFNVMKTVPFFWIPMHTIVFCMPGEYRIVASAFLSIALGLILSYAKRKSN